MAGVRLCKYEFEVHGKVQGVFFRRDTKITAEKLGIKGWVMNTAEGTVIGAAEGSKDALDKLKHWLTKVGSKKSRITKCDIKNLQQTDKGEFSEFKVIR